MYIANPLTLSKLASATGGRARVLRLACLLLRYSLGRQSMTTFWPLIILIKQKKQDNKIYLAFLILLTCLRFALCLMPFALLLGPLIGWRLNAILVNS